LSGSWLLAWAVTFGVLLVQEARANCESCINLVFDGDSISAGVGSTPGHGLDDRVIARLGGGVRSRNVAVSGRPVSQAAQLYSDLVEPLFDQNIGYNVIVFHAGDNDIAQGRDAAQTYAAFSAYVAEAHREGWKVVVSTELRRPDFGGVKEAKLAEYNMRLRGNDAHADAVVDFDQDKRMADLSWRADRRLFARDRIHPADDGYAILAEMLAPAVKAVAGR
jgi:lysophospholipase L1-like esterase